MMFSMLFREASAIESDVQVTGPAIRHGPQDNREEWLDLGRHRVKRCVHINR